MIKFTVVSFDKELILKTEKDDLPYLFEVGDKIQISADGEIITIRKDSRFNVQTVPNIKWLNERLEALTLKLKTALDNDNFASQTDLYERNYLLEIWNKLNDPQKRLA